jgi:hypothetical protein
VQKRSTCTILVGKYEGKIPLERPRSKWKDNMRYKIGIVAKCSAIFNNRITYVGSRNSYENVLA